MRPPLMVATPSRALALVEREASGKLPVGPRKTPPYMLSQKSKFRISWDLLMFSLLMYVIVSLPLAFAFDKEIGQHLCQYDLSVDACFVVVGDDFGLVLLGVAFILSLIALCLLFCFYRWRIYYRH